MYDYCPFNYVLGTQHQVKKINDKYAKDGIKAYRIKKDGDDITKGTIVITQGEVVWLGDYQSEELVNKKYLGIKNPELIRIIDAPETRNLFK